MAKPGKRKKRPPLQVRGCAFCPAEVELYRLRWDGREWDREYEDAGWGVIEDVKPGHPGWNACPKCYDRVGPGPIDHEVPGLGT